MTEPSEATGPGDDLRARLEAQVALRRGERVRARSASDAQRHQSGGGRNSLGRLPLRLTLILVVAAGLAVGLRAWVIQPYWIPSQSMEPTLHGCPGCDPDRLLVDKLSYRLHPVHRGDVVVFARPAGIPFEDQNLVKRVIGLGGESVRASGGSIFINDRQLSEPYIAAACNGTRDFGPVSVPAGSVFVMGDNRCDSTDSRVFGPIATKTIVGRAFVIVWPLSRLHWL